ncbi:MAG: TerC family protein [Burkholderiaceae bacterium]
MLELFVNLNWAAVGQIIMIDILLGGDNAVVIALACRNLPANLRTKGIVYGTIGAIAIRVVLIIFAVSLLTLPYLKIIGGLLLLWIGIKLLMPEPEEEHRGLDGGSSLMTAVKTVVVADLVMSIDNVIGIAGAAQGAATEHQTGLIIFGLLVSIPIIVFGSRFVLILIERFPLVVMAGGALLGWIAGGMMITDVALIPWFGPDLSQYALVASIVGAAVVLIVPKLLSSGRLAESERRS